MAKILNNLHILLEHLIANIRLLVQNNYMVNTFDRIKGGKPFDTSTEWFTTLLSEIGQA